MPNTIYFITGDLRDQQTLLAGLPFGADVHLLDQELDGLSEIAKVLSDRCEIDTLHLLSHGHTGSIQLGIMSLTSDNVEDYASILRRIGVSMSARGEILLYGCNVAEGIEGQEFVASLATLTNTRIAASTTPVGASALGGNWELDARCGKIESEVLEVTDYTGVLAGPTFLSATMATGSSVVLLNYSTTLQTVTPPSASLFSVTIDNIVYTPSSLGIVNTLTAAAATTSTGTVELFLPTTLAAGAHVISVNYTPSYPAGVTDLTGGVIQGITVAPNDVLPLVNSAVTTVASSAPTLLSSALTVGATATATSSLVMTYSAALAVAAALTIPLTSFTVSVDGVLSNPTVIAAIAANATTVTLTLPATVTASILSYGTHSVALNYTPSLPANPLPVAPAVVVAPAVDNAAGVIQGATAAAVGGTNDAAPIVNFAVPVPTLTAAQLLIGATNTAPIITATAATTPYTENALPTAVNAAFTITDSYWKTGSMSVSITAGMESGDTLLLPIFATGLSGISVSSTQISANTYAVFNSGIQIGTTTAQSSNGALWTFNFTSATNAQVQALTRAISYSSTSDHFLTLSRGITFSFTDAVLAVATVANTVSSAQIINITPVNDAPTLTQFAAPVATGSEDTAIPVTFANLQSQGNQADIDGTVVGFVVKTLAPGTTLSITNTITGVTTQFAAGTNDLIDATHTANWTAPLNANGIQNAFTVVALDGGVPVQPGLLTALPALASSTPVQVQLSVTPVNDIPTIDLDSTNITAPGTGSSNIFLPRGPAVQVISNNVLINDPDIVRGAPGDVVTQASATIGVGGVDTPYETLYVQGANIVTVGAQVRFKLPNYNPSDSSTYLAVTGNNTTKVTFTGTSTWTQYEAALKTIVYNNSNSFATGGDRSINVDLKLMDASPVAANNVMTTASAVATIKVPWAPVIDLDGGATQNVNDRNYTASYVEGASAAAVTSWVKIAAADSTITDLQGNVQSVTIAVRTPGVEDTLSISAADQAVLAGYGITTTATTGNSITFSQNVAKTVTTLQFQNALHTVLFGINSQYPPNLVRSIDVTSIDVDGNIGLAATTTLNVIRTNDAPVVTPVTVVGAINEGTVPGAPLSTGGSFTFADPDLNDRPTATVTGFSSTGPVLLPEHVAALKNAFQVSALPGNTNGGTINWNFALTEDKISFLGAGEVVNATFTVTLSDHNGGTANQNVTLTITGTNDAPVITPLNVAGTALVPSVSTGGNVVSSGSFTFADNDLIDRPTASITALPTLLSATILNAAGTTIGSLTGPQLTAITNGFSLSALATNTNTGTVNWNFSLPDNAISLTRGQHVLATFGVTVSDNLLLTPGTAIQNITVDITRNSAPVISVVDVAGNITEGSVLSDAGSISYTDADNDVANATRSLKSAVWLKADGVTSMTLPVAVNPLTPFTITQNTPNTVNWNFTSTEANLNFLAKGETINATYTITLNDGFGGVSTQDVSVLVTGTNDAPIVTPDIVAANITEGGKLNDFGFFTFTDVDLSDRPTVTHAQLLPTSIIANNGLLQLTAEQKTAIENAFTLNPVIVANSGTVNWNYGISEQAINFLTVGDTVTATLTVVVDDHNGGVTTQDITVNITGAADAPTINVGPAATVPVIFKVSGDGVALFDQSLALATVDRGDLIQKATVALDATAVNNAITTYETLYSVAQAAGTITVNGHTFTVSGNGTAGNPLVISGAGSAAEYTTALQSIYYTNTSLNAAAGDRTITVTLDGSHATSTATTLVNVNWTPKVDLNGNAAGLDYAVKFNQNHLPGGATNIPIAADTSTIFADYVTITKVVVSLENPLDGINGADEQLSINADLALQLSTQFGITTTVDSSGHKITLEIINPLTNNSNTAFNTALRAINYNDSSLNPNTSIVRQVLVDAYDADTDNSVGISASTSITFNNPAHLTAAVATLSASGTGTGQLTITDSDSPATFIAQSGVHGAYGTFALQSDGTWSYNLDAGLVAGTSYSDTFDVYSADFTKTTVEVHTIASSVQLGGGGTGAATVTLPVGTGLLEVNHTGTVITGATPAEQLLSAQTFGTAYEGAFRYLQTLDSSTAVQAMSQAVFHTINLNAATGATAGDPISINGSLTSPGHLEALVIDASNLPSGTIIHLNNVSFAEVIGAVHLDGGDGENYVVGDASAQYMVLGAGNDTLYGGAGNDTIGSLGGNDLIFGEAGNDLLIDGFIAGGNGNDTLDGGDGIDTIQFNGRLSDYSITLLDEATNTYQINDNRLTDSDGQNLVRHVENFVFLQTNANDTTAPLFSGLNTNNGGYANDIVITFNEAILKGAGVVAVHAGSATGAIVATSADPVAGTTGAAVTTSATGFGTTLTINPTSNLAPNSHYVVTVDGTAVRDLAGNYFAGGNYSFDTISTSNGADPYAGTGHTGDGATTAVVGLSAFGLLAWALL